MVICSLARVSRKAPNWARQDERLPYRTGAAALCCARTARLNNGEGCVRGWCLTIRIPGDQLIHFLVP